MAERELFQIGEVAKMYHLSVGTLRHYEQVGLLKPEYTDPATGYRYYSVRQFEQLTNIRYLRALGLPLDEIAATLHDRDVDNIAEALRRQKELIARKKQELEIMERKIDHRLAQLEDARRSELDCIRLVEQPALRLVLLRDSVKFNSYLWLERSIRKIEQDQKLPLSYIGKVGVGISEENLKSAEFGHYDLVFLVLEEDDVYEGRVETLPPCRCAAVRFRGDHSRAPQYYEQLAQFLAANGLRIAGFSREITLIDNCISDDPAQYVTEIRIPVARGEMQLSRAGRRGVSLANDREVGPRRKASGRNRGFRNVAACDYVGIVSGNNTPDKMEKSGLTAEKSAVVDAPLFTQLPLTLECKYVHSTEEGNIIGEIVNISADERILGADGKIDMTKFRPISYEPVHNGYHVLGERVGTAFSDGMKLK